MKRLVFGLLVAVAATAAYSACGGCGAVKSRHTWHLSVSVSCNRAPVSHGCCSSSGYLRTLPGPEETGDYAQPYLYSPTTGKWYADPMYYYAQGTMRRWHEIRSLPLGPPVKEYTEEKPGQN